MSVAALKLTLAPLVPGVNQPSSAPESRMPIRWPVLTRQSCGYSVNDRAPGAVVIAPRVISVAWSSGAMS